MLHRIVTICLLFVLYAGCVTCCEDRCYEPEGTTRTSSGQLENDLIISGICYSSCTSTLQTYQIEDFSVVNTSSLDCEQTRQLNGCITGCNTTAKNAGSDCQELCSTCQATGVTGCNSCDYQACLIGCNATADNNRTGIDLNNINVTLVPIPGQLYTYKASIASRDADEVSVSRQSTTTSSVSSFIIRVSAMEDNLTTYSLLHDPMADYVDLLDSGHHCSLANVSVAVVNSDGISEYSPATEMCISARYPEAATDLRACFGERLVNSSSEQWLINLNWNLPEGTTYLQGFELNAISTTDNRRCREARMNSAMLDKNQTSYTLGNITRRCNYRITLTSLPRLNDSSLVMIDQFADLPDRVCRSTLPQHNVTLTQQFYTDSFSIFTVEVMLESDPAALQALQLISIHVAGYRSFNTTPANQFPEILLPVSNSTVLNNYGSECFIERNRRYTCSGNCNSLQYRGSQLDSCIEECERARHYTISSSQLPANENYTFFVSFRYSTQYSYRCRYNTISLRYLDSVSRYPEAATDLQTCFGERLVSNSSEQWLINLNWNLPEDTTYLQGFELNVISTADNRRCRATPTNSAMLDKNQTSYTLGNITRRCNYRITLTSLPRLNDSSSVVRNQLADLPDRLCPSTFPLYNRTLIRRNNNNSLSNFTIELMLESDPAALQALQSIRVSVEGDRRFTIPANHFRRYTCSGNCNSLQYRGSQLENCIEECELARHYTIRLSQSYPTNENYTFHVTYVYQSQYSYRCRYIPVRLRSLDAVCYLSSVPRNLNFTYEVQHNISNVLFVNLTWEAPEYTHGIIKNYLVEYETADGLDPVTTDVTSEHMISRTIFKSTFIRVSAENGCGFSDRSNTVLVNLTGLFPSVSTSSDDDPPYHRYYIASGVVVGCMIFAAVVLTIIVVCCCYVCKSSKQDKVVIYEAASIVGSTPYRGANEESDDPYNKDSELPIDRWEISPGNVEMDETTFFACGNFGEVYKGRLTVETKSDTDVYPAGKIVAVKLLQEGAGGELKHDFLQEISLMKKVAQGGNPFVVNMIGCCTLEEPLALIMEFVPGGNLLEFLKSHRPNRTQSNAFGKTPAPYLEPSTEYSQLKSKEEHEEEQKKPLSVADLLTFAYQIACGMEYLSARGIVHRDLACRNVLVGEQNNMKIADFGLSKHLYDDPVYVKNQDGKLPIRWMAIEAIMERKYSVQSDIWSFGIVIWELVTFGGYPYPTLTNIEVVDALLKGFRMECPNTFMCPPELYALAERCWDGDPELRPSFNMLAKEISNMIPDYDPNQYVEIARYSPYCQMYSSDNNTLEKKDSVKQLDSEQDDS